MNAQYSQCMHKGQCYNTTICTKLNGQIFEDYLKTRRKDRYEFIFSVDAYGKYHVSIPSDASSGGGRPMSIISSKESVFKLVTQSALLTTVSNALNSIIRSES